MHAVFGIAFILGFILPESVLSGSTQPLLVTFFGLLSAGLIPAVVLLLTAQLPSSYSVAQVTKVEAETDQLLNRLISTLSIIVLGGVATMVSAAGTPVLSFQTKLHLLNPYLENVPHRVLQGIVFACFVIGLDRLRIFAATLKAARKLRRDFTLEEAKRHLERTAPSPDEVKAGFRRSQNFGGSLRVVTAPPVEPDA